MDTTTFDEILSSLETLLGVTKESDIAILTEILNDAIAEIKAARHYPSDMSAADIEADMLNYISNVKKLAKYDYNQIGAEYQEQHSENGVSRHYSDRRKCFDGVVPFCVQF
jgi:hypothetical protein